MESVRGSASLESLGTRCQTDLGSKKLTYGNVINLMKPFAELVSCASISTQESLMKGFQGLYSAATMGMSNNSLCIDTTLHDHLRAFQSSMNDRQKDNRKRPPEASSTGNGDFQRRNNVTNIHRPAKSRLRSSLESKKKKGSKNKPVVSVMKRDTLNEDKAVRTCGCTKNIWLIRIKLIHSNLDY